MICASCGATEAQNPCAKCADDPVLVDRYELRELLGRRGAASTFLAFDRGSDSEVVIKELMLRATESLKEVELFEREAELLEQLDHRSIPRHLAHFEHQRGKTVSLYNVQEHVEGTSLEKRLAAHRFDEEEVLGIIASLADTLAYLREHDPPVVHRDVKPDNVLMKDDGTVVLVDFGAARAVAETLHASGSTVTGTFGYMAPEQLLGSAVPASDVYGLGATAIRLLTGREPHDLLDADRRYDWHQHASVSPQTADLVDAMTSPAPESRPTDLARLAEDAREAASGSTDALTRYQTAALSTSPRERPSTGAIIRRVARDPAGKYLFLFALAVATLLIVGLLFPAIVSEPFVLFYAVAVLLASPVLVGKRMFVPIRAAWLIYTGASVRGIVTRRENVEKNFVLTYEYRPLNETYKATEVVGPDIYFECPPGTEVEVFFRPKKPQVSTIAPIGE